MRKMVLIDDEPLMLEGFSKAISWQEYGYKLIGAFRSPENLIDFCGKHHPDVILMDINMPDMDGITALKQIKQIYPAVKVIMLTAHNEFDYARDALRYHADEYLWKPEINFEDIVVCMDRLFAQNVQEESAEKADNRELQEFVQYRPEESIFSARVFHKILEDIEQFLKLENLQLVSQSMDRMWEMILTDHPGKRELLGEMMHVAYLFREALSKYRAESAEKLEEMLLSCLYRSSDYQDFIMEAENILNGKLEELKKRKEENSEQLQQTIETYIQQNLQKTDLNLMEIANVIGVSYSYFSRLFPEIMGKNYSKYLIEKRLEKACEYLKFSDFKIDRILEMTGYTDKSYFIKSFRHYTGMTPAKYRVKYKDEENQKEKR